MNTHALDVLEYRRALELVARHAASTPAREAILALRPMRERARIEFELERVRQTMVFVGTNPAWGPAALPDVRGALARVQTPGAVADGIEIHRLGLLLAASRELGTALERHGESLDALRQLAAQLVARPALETVITRSVDAEGTLLDTASAELGRIRSALRRAHQRIVRRLDAYMAGLPERLRVPDASVTVREGRYVIPLRREGRGEVGGIVHDESGTGATIFVEPPVGVELMNEVRDLERDEGREIARILRELSATLHREAPALVAAHAALVDFDTLHARARAALGWRGDVPQMLDPGSGTLRLVRMQHPLLLARDDIDTVVPCDLELDEDERTLVVSGPNTGGKSVFLKATGLVAMLAQSGIVPPVAAGTRLPVFTGFFADIGDEQSIAASLSTFSAHLANLSEVVAGADRGALVLLDEMGTGTDPTEGAALARSILESLTARGARTIATSHLGALKTLDAPGSGIVNASLEFDAERMEPTYRLVKGRPGRSYGLAIARRLGLPAELLDRAEQLVDEGAASLEDLLERLETQEREARERSERTAQLEARVEGLEAELTARERTLRERERSAETRAREQARQLLLNAREQVEVAIAEVRAAQTGALDEAARAARRRIEEAARRQKERASGAGRSRGAGDGAGAGSGAGAAAEVAVGARVRLPGSASAIGTVVELRDGRASVEVGGLRVGAPAADLVVVEGASTVAARTGAHRDRDTRGADAPRRERGWAGELPEARHEIDVRGMRADELDMALGRAIDAAVLADLAELRIIHGKGTGAARSRVLELLEADRRVGAFRAGLHGEGGAGVTVARLGAGA